MDGETHTLVLIFPADVIREVDARRQGRSRIEVIAEAVWATRAMPAVPVDDAWRSYSDDGDHAVV